MQLTLGQVHVTLNSRGAVYTLAHGVETSQWVTTEEPHIKWTDGTAIVSITRVILQVLHSSERWVLVTLLDVVGCVVVVGLFLTVTVDKVLFLPIVEMVTVDRVDKEDRVSLRSHSSKKNEILRKRVSEPSFFMRLYK